VFRLGTTRFPPAVTGAVAAFCKHIVGIIQHSSQEKMVRAYAFWVIALMQNAHAIWNGAIVKFPGNPMGSSLTSVASSKFYTTVAVPVASGSPQPACIGFLDFRPESFDQGLARLARLLGAGGIVGLGPLAFVLAQFWSRRIRVRLPARFAHFWQSRVSSDCRCNTCSTARCQSISMRCLLEKTGQRLRLSMMRAKWVGADFCIHDASITHLGAL
jgi:hypothetical protein